jgi:hypothetical protein
MGLLKDEDVFLGLRLLENLRPDPDRDTDFAEVGLVEEQHPGHDLAYASADRSKVNDELHVSARTGFTSAV